MTRAPSLLFSTMNSPIFVQAALKNSVHAAVLQPRANAARLPLRRTLAVIGTRNGIQVTHDRFVTGGGDRGISSRK